MAADKKTYDKEGRCAMSKVCPYCGRDIEHETQEHFFPKSVYANSYDFYACRECNYLKRNHIVYPSSDLFKIYPTEFSRVKFNNLWDISGYSKYPLLVPWKQMRRIFDGEGTYYDDYSFTLEERQFYKFERLSEIIDFADAIIDNDSKVRALVLSCNSPVMYLVHTYPFEFKTPYQEVRSIQLSKYLSTNSQGLRVSGFGGDYLWKLTSDYREYFNKLLGRKQAWECLTG